MSKKGRRARQKRRGSVAPSPQAMEQVVSSDVDASPSAPPPPTEMVDAVPALPSLAADAKTPSERPPQSETPLSFSAQEPLPLPSRDDSSFPPVDLDSHFFSPTPEADESHERDPRMVLKLGPEAARRRAQFQKYVKIAVAAASVLCLAALVKGAVARNHDEPAPHRASAAVVAPPVQAQQPVQTAAVLEQVPPPPEQPAAAEPQAAPPAGNGNPTETATAAPAPPAAEQAAPSAAPAPAEVATAAADGVPTGTATDTAEAPTPDPKEAAKAKRASQTALERGKIGDAIEAGERSVSLDPTDAEAWLILGAAYQSKGDQKNARRSFKSCLEQGKRGPRWECAQMPH